ncbi:DUF481 domain-containing protein [Shewanella sp. JBTF-M18]|uniref:DUF481 domain-containing protein n=1 Tax=Shewanella insulae TaxID=2681496 RepID=A0A6L7HYQ3_9GAMM|nr:DUF481 domain-containing protein [Shewanella insulae]MXR68814.1 DUF481 domain-containing protein [Shewanella insulae]
MKTAFGVIKGRIAIGALLRLGAILLSMVSFGTAQLAHAEQRGFSVTLSGFYSNSDSGIVVQNPNLGTDFTLDFENDLTLVEKELLPTLELAYWFNQDHGVYLDWKRLDREARNRAISKPYEYTEVNSGQTYLVQAGADISTIFNVDILRLGYRYNLYSDEEVDLTLLAGLHLMWLKLQFVGEIGACLDEECRVVDINPKSNALTEVTAPLPDLGLQGRYRFNDRWSLSGWLQYFYVSLGDTKGQLFDFSAGVNYRLSDSLDLELGYKYYKIDVEVEKDLADFDVYYGFKGPALSLTYKF